MGNSRRQRPHERHTFGFDEPFSREISLVRSFREQFFESLSVAERLVLGFFPSRSARIDPRIPAQVVTKGSR